MGLLSLFRHTTSTPTPKDANASRTATPSGSTSTPRPTTPTSSIHLSTPGSLLESPKIDFLRPAIPPSSPSSSSITSRLTKKPWKKGSPDVSSKEKKDKGKGKGKASSGSEELIGLAYEDTPLPLPPPLGGPRASHSAPTPPQPPRRAESLLPDGPAQNSPLAASISLSDMPSTDHEERLDDDHLEHTASHGEGRRTLRDARVESGQFRQEGGILGKLNFEFETFGTSPPEKWVNRASTSPTTITVSTDQPLQQPRLLPEDGVVPDHQNQRGQAEHGVLPPSEDTGAVEHNHGRRTPTQDQIGAAEDEKMEMIESAEKKTKFWKRPRRPSRDVNDVMPEIERSGSPTPRKPSAVAAPADKSAPRTSTDAQPIRPPQLRRPSSSLFHNPFTRSVSRLSLAHDLDRPPVDDGSFQLRGFRHVSGTMDTEGAGELENYLAHVRKDQRPSTSTDVLTSPVAADIPRPPSAFVTRARPSTIAIPRPPSIANSLASATGDDLPIPSGRVSVAAFRKGIRRPSEGLLTTMSDVGHGGHSQGLANGQQSPLHTGNGDDDDEDDLPLGMLNKRKELGREESSQSLSSLRQSAEHKESMHTSSESISRKPSPAIMADRSFSPSPALENPPSRRASPALGVGESLPRKPSPSPNSSLSFTVQRHKHERIRGGSGGFVVKSTRLTRDDLLPKVYDGQPGELRPAAFTTPPVSGPPTPLSPSDQEKEKSDGPAKRDNKISSSSPEEIPAVDGYFSSIAPLVTDYSDQHPTTPLNHIPPADKTITVPPSSQGPRQTPSPGHAPGPPVEPISLPQPGDKTPVSMDLNLPLPPDQMPDTPPKQPVDLTSSPMSPGTRKRLSLLEEPMRIISGLWNSPPSGGEDGFDPALVVSSMNAFGDEEQERKREPSPGAATEDKAIEHHPSQTTLLDANKVNTAPGERVRSPLSDRLAGITSTALGAGIPSKTSLAKLRTGTATSGYGQTDEPIDGYATERMKSPASDSTLSPTMSTVPPPAHRRRHPDSASPSQPTFASSFARAQPRRSQVEESSSEETDTEATNSSTPQAPAKVQAKMKIPKAVGGAASEGYSPGRRVPSGPRKLSVSNRKRVSSHGPLPPTSPRRPHSSFVPAPAHAKAQKKVDKEGESSEPDDEPLGILLNKASMSSLSVDKYGKQRLPRTESTSGQSISSLGTSQQGRSPALRVVGLPSPQERRKTLVELGPVVQPIRDRSADHGSEAPAPTSGQNSSRGQVRPRAQSRASSRARTPSASAAGTTRPSPGRTLVKLPPEPELRNKNASPDSSRSATTGGSGAYQPMTPKEGNEREREKRGQPVGSGIAKQIPPEPPIHHELPVEERPRAYSSYGDERGQNSAPSMYDQQMAQMPIDPQSMQGMNPDAIRTMMKQQWQMQFMAAAYRASEEEWERQSSVSAHTNHTTPASFGGQGQYMPTNMGMGMGVPPMPMGYGMGMNMGYPGINGPYGYPYPQGQNQGYGMFGGYPMPPQSPVGGGGGMYSYGAGARSVFGGEFGPPPLTPSGRFPYQPSGDVPQYSTQSAIGVPTGPQRGRRGSSSGAKSLYASSVAGGGGVQAQPNPPSSWNRRSGSGSGDWGDLSQLQGAKGRPQTHYAN